MSEEEFIKKLYHNHKACQHNLSPEFICRMVNRLLQLLFPDLSDKCYTNFRDFEQEYRLFRLELFKALGTLSTEVGIQSEVLEKQFLEKLPNLRESLEEDAVAILAGDPAATSKAEVIRTYPGFYALAVFRIAHIFYKMKLPLLPRILTEYAHQRTGIDIHPGAAIGARFCVDHGTGIVIGETVKIGNDVKIYQGVTLGALSVRKSMAQMKRHPTIEDNVIIYAGATILGGETVIGHDSIIGGNVWIVKSVLPYSRIYYGGINVEKQQI